MDLSAYTARPYVQPKPLQGPKRPPSPIAAPGPSVSASPSACLLQRGYTGILKSGPTNHARSPKGKYRGATSSAPLDASWDSSPSPLFPVSPLLLPHLAAIPKCRVTSTHPVFPAAFLGTGLPRALSSSGRIFLPSDHSKVLHFATVRQVLPTPGPTPERWFESTFLASRPAGPVASKAPFLE